MIGAKQTRTPKPNIIMKGNHGMWVKPWRLTKQAATEVKIGVAHDHKKGTAKV